MATYEKVKIITMKTGAAVTYGEFVKVSGADVTVIAGTANTDICIGVAQEAAAASGDVIPIAIGGIAKVVAGATIVRGAQVTCHTTAQAITAASGDVVQGIALSSAVVNDVFDVLITPSTQLLA